MQLWRPRAPRHLARELDYLASVAPDRKVISMGIFNVEDNLRRETGEDGWGPEPAPPEPSEPQGPGWALPVALATLAALVGALIGVALALNLI